MGFDELMASGAVSLIIRVACMNELQLRAGKQRFCTSNIFQLGSLFGHTYDKLII